MASAQDLKQNLIDYLINMDKSKLSMIDLGGYVFIVKSLMDMESSNPSGKDFEKLSCKEGDEHNG